MKRVLIVFLLMCLALPMFVACDDAGVNDGSEANSDNSAESANDSDSDTSEEISMEPDKDAVTFWKDEYSNGDIKSANDVYNLKAFKDGNSTEDYNSLPAGDTRFIFEGLDSSRAVVLSEGYALTLPGKDITPDFSLGALRSKYKGENYVLTVSYEDKNPYGANPNGWKTYYDEWLARYFVNIDFLTENNIRRTRQMGETTELLNGYVVNYFDFKINVATKMEYDCYSIAIVRPANSYEYFWFFVLKSKGAMYKEMDDIVASFKEIKKEGKPINSVGAYELKIPEFWNDETKAYYNKLLTQTTVDMGAFFQGRDQEYMDWFASEEGINSNLDIYMDYLHIGWYGSSYSQSNLDVNFMLEHAGGNGFNGKPVLELTYQFTTTNNGLGGYTPMFDICRGRIDAQFRRLAKDIKKYGKPVLFRLNNEMNTDWTSYCGMQTLNDPDIFIDTWRRLYDIFKEEGVDNCIWIWNPISTGMTIKATGCPYSNWGDQLCYWPGSDYVQMLGLTFYQMNNDSQIESFKDMYTKLYKTNTPYFDNFPAIIGEFACGAGGEVIYDWGKGGYVPVMDLETKKQWQANWINGMFDCFMKNQEPGYEFAKNIKAATWFSCNDYADVDGESKVINYLRLDSGVPKALEAFRNGYAKLKEAREK
jgi:hypothetical protein